MIMTRRLFIGTATAGLAGLSGLLPKPAIAAGKDLFAAAWIQNGGAGFSILDGDGNELTSVSLPDRGHDVATDRAGRWAVAFARRPGTFAVAVDRQNGSEPIPFSTPEDRHFFGHGVFSPDGRVLYATENDYDNAAGMIGIYDVTAGFNRIGEFPSYGIDPHELILMPGGKTLCIANGGIETHPDFGRAKLNLASMEPSVVFVDIESGELLEKHTPPADLFRLSTRHMDIDAAGNVWVGCQYEGPETDEPPLLLRVTMGEGYKPIMLPDQARHGLANYVGSVAANRSENRLVITSPHGNCALVLDTRSGNLVERIAEKNVCGAVAQGSGFLLSSAEGDFGEAKLGRSWDNHIARLFQER
ncbi:DUF1513 domain-containing protein [Pseudohoeflea suaedae]|nr:DUF1513 domain-containing protein [Pseudohoeflea suaedae]